MGCLDKTETCAVDKESHGCGQQMTCGDKKVTVRQHEVQKKDVTMPRDGMPHCPCVSCHVSQCQGECPQHTCHGERRDKKNG